MDKYIIRFRRVNPHEAMIVNDKLKELKVNIHDLTNSMALVECSEETVALLKKEFDCRIFKEVMYETCNT